MKNIVDKLKDARDYYGYEEFLSSRNWHGDSKDIVLCDISPSQYRPFYLGANIIDNVINESRFNCGRALWEPNNQPMEWKTQEPVKNFGIVAICAYMYYQLFGIPGFLADCKIQPLSRHRKDGDPIVILGGQMFYLWHGYNQFIDIACIGEGEEFILELLELKDRFKGSREAFLCEAAKIDGAYVPSVHGDLTDSPVKKRSLSMDSLIEYSKKGTLKTKHLSHVIEVARGCKYSCGFCALHRRMYPFRAIPADVIKEKLSNFDEDTHIYPFAPDEASYKDREIVVDWCKIRGLKVYHYNYRLDTIKESDILTGNIAKQIVLGIDGISQRIIDATGKGIRLEKLTNEIAPLIFKNDFIALKLNFVFNYVFETDEDYRELERFLVALIELRIKANSGCFIHVAATPFLPEHLTPLQYAGCRTGVDSRFENIINRIKSHYFDVLKIEPRIKMEGTQGSENYNTAVLMHRIERLSDLVYYCYKRGYRKSAYSPKLYELVLNWLTINKVSPEKLRQELDIDTNWVFDGIDWVGDGTHSERTRRFAKLILKRLGETC